MSRMGASREPRERTRSIGLRRSLIVEHRLVHRRRISPPARARERGLVHARSHIERLLGHLPSHCALVTVLDGHPASLGWLGSVSGHRVRALGVEHFGQTGTIADLYRHYGIDANSIVAAAQAIAPGRPIRHLKAL